jgi:signal transduction histidine kinase
LPFSASDEETLLRFATQAALALERSHAHARLRALAVAEERLRIARELHDSVAQVLAFVNAKSQAIQEQLRSGRIAEAQAQLARLAAASRETYTDVRESILALRAAGEEARPLAEALRDYSERWEDQTGIAVQLKLQADPELPPGVQTQLLRITQEALANVRKHSAAKEVTVQLTKEGPYLQLLVRDNGCGFDVGAQADAKKPSFGLTSMRERASSIGAELCVESEPNRGTTVQVRLPLRSYRELADVIEQAP